jgi:hypothetical protein
MRLWDTCLVALVFLYGLNLAPMMFETFTSDRTWASNPPDSFHMFLGQYGHKTAHYWRVVSPLASLAFVLSFIAGWHVPDRRLWLSVAFVLYLMVHLSTMVYFVPEQEGLISSAGSLSRDVLQSRANRWMFLNYFRNAAGVLAYVALMLAVLVPRR